MVRKKRSDIWHGRHRFLSVFVAFAFIISSLYVIKPQQAEAKTYTEITPISTEIELGIPDVLTETIDAGTKIKITDYDFSEFYEEEDEAYWGLIYGFKLHLEYEFVSIDEDAWGTPSFAYTIYYSNGKQETAEFSGEDVYDAEIGETYYVTLNIFSDWEGRWAEIEEEDEVATGIEFEGDESYESEDPVPTPDSGKKPVFSLETEAPAATPGSGIRPDDRTASTSSPAVEVPGTGISNAASASPATPAPVVSNPTTSNTSTTNVSSGSSYSSDDEDDDDDDDEDDDDDDDEDELDPPGKVKIKSVKNTSKKSATVKWKKVSDADRYQVVYALNKKFTKGKKTKRTSKTTLTLKKLKKGKTYWVKIRAYALDEEDDAVYGKWSAVKKVKIKK